jgi:hypothetical protein
MSKDDVKKIFESLPDEFVVVEDGIDIATQQEYIAYTATLDSKNHSAEAIDGKIQRLFDSDTSREEKKELLARLAHTGKVTTIKVIEQFLKTGEPELHDWAKLSLHECQLFVDNVWSDDESMGMVMSGLGGENNRLRYFLAVRSKSKTQYTSVDRIVIAEIFVEICRKYDSILEDIQIQPTYVTMKVLIPLDVAVGMIIEDGISQCNENRRLLDENYYVTNVKIPTEEELQAFLKPSDQQR